MVIVLSVSRLLDSGIEGLLSPSAFQLQVLYDAHDDVLEGKLFLDRHGLQLGLSVGEEPQLRLVVFKQE